MPRLAYRLQSWARRLSIGTQRLWARFVALGRIRVSRSWVVGLRLLIAMTTGSMIQSTPWPPSVILLSLIWLLVWAIWAPHPDQWRD